MLEIEKLTVCFGDRCVLDAVSMSVKRGEVLGIVGESGSGKTMTALSVMGLLNPQAQIKGGSIRLDGRELTGLDERSMSDIRGKDIAMIFQEPMTSLNPSMRIGRQLGEAVRLHKIPDSRSSAKEIKSRVLEALADVKLPEPERIYESYPHELSGGMRQRVMIAMALSCNPRLIIADEPTTALDVTIQAQILDLLRNLKDKINSSIMLITHDLGVIAEMADYVVVMYAGRVVEKGTAQEIFANPAHPYTIGLMASKPMVGKKVDKLYSIPGKVPNPINMPNYCYFKDRCEMCVEGCQGEYPHMIQLSPTHMVSCYRYYGKEDAQNG